MHYPAQMIGVANRLGSLEVSKEATVLVTSGDPLEVTTRVETVYIEGRPVDLSNLQTCLYEKYQRKYAPWGRGRRAVPAKTRGAAFRGDATAAPTANQPSV